MSCLAPGEAPLVTSMILDERRTAKRATQHWATEQEPKVELGVWMGCTHGWHSGNGQMGAAALCKYSNICGTHHSYLGTERMEVFDAELWVIGPLLQGTVKIRERLQMHRLKPVAVFSGSQAVIRLMAQPELGAGSWSARWIHRREQDLRALGSSTQTYRVPGHHGIIRNKDADRSAKLRWHESGGTAKKQPYPSSSNRASHISQRSSAAKAKWEADKYSKHFSYRLKSKIGTKRPVPMTSVEWLAARYYRPYCMHAPTGVYLKQFGHRKDDKCW